MFFSAIRSKRFFLIVLFLGYVISSFLLFFYSYTQVDLSLTLSRVSIWQAIQKFFQHIGYFERPLSTIMYCGILVFFYILYGVALWGVRKRFMDGKKFWYLIGVIVAIMVFSYPAFSYDIFNYMFTAKTILLYHKNPYEVIPLQFTGVEPWLSFMRWTHLSSAYTPLWILLTLPAYLLGFGYFLLILWNIKLFVGVFYVIATWYIGKILSRIKPDDAIFGMAVFALNPLVIIESLVSAHNDIVMMAIAMVSFYLFLNQRQISSFFFLALSVAMKLMTIFLFPIAFLKWNRKAAFFAMGTGFVLVLLQREVLPWYFVWIMPFIALLPEWPQLVILGGGISIGLLLRYAPYLYFGHWDNPVPLIKAWVTWVPILLSLGIVLMMFRANKRNMRTEKQKRLS